MSETILLTGAGGFLGTAAAELLLKIGYNVKCLVRRKNSLKKQFNCEQIVADIRDLSSLSGITKQVDIVVHAAGLTKARKSSDFYEVNLEGTKNLINSLDKNVRQFIYISSLSAAGPRKNPKENSSPISYYGKSKLMAENEVKKLKIPATIIRPPALYGPYDRDFFLFFKLAKSGYVIVPKSDNFLSLMHVSDAARSILFAINNKDNEAIYEIDDGTIYKQYDIIKCIIQIVNSSAHLIRLPMEITGILRFLSYTGIFGKLLNPDKLKEAQYSWVADSSYILSKGFFPTITLENGIKSTSEWYESNRWYR
ncbi:MAG: NAD(P)-dependent oxidoreductase [Epsilonproteobacteria bacterium]|nr:NAD(P)-dependent oxidoreductase [Campylobacterota bacterium]